MRNNISMIEAAFDEVDGVGKFVELEAGVDAESEDSERLAKAKFELAELATQIGLHDAKHAAMSSYCWRPANSSRSPQLSIEPCSVRTDIVNRDTYLGSAPARRLASRCWAVPGESQGFNFNARRLAPAACFRRPSHGVRENMVQRTWWMKLSLAGILALGLAPAMASYNGDCKKDDEGAFVADCDKDGDCDKDEEGELVADCEKDGDCDGDCDEEDEGELVADCDKDGDCDKDDEGELFADCDKDGDCDGECDGDCDKDEDAELAAC